MHRSVNSISITHIFDVVWSYDLSILINSSLSHNDDVQTLTQLTLLSTNTQLNHVNVNVNVNIEFI